jgi:hypothetical protein
MSGIARTLSMIIRRGRGGIISLGGRVNSGGGLVTVSDDT